MWMVRVSAGALGGCILSLGFDHINDDDELDVHINGEPVPWDKRRIFQDGWGYTVFDGVVYHTTMATERVEGTLIQFDVTDLPIKTGNNELLVRLIKGAGPHFAPVTLTEVRLAIDYR